jgi:hypothetical protein
MYCRFSARGKHIDRERARAGEKHQEERERAQRELGREKRSLPQNEVNVVQTFFVGFKFRFSPFKKSS